MCDSLADGGRRCPDSRRISKLTANDLAPHTAGAPAVEWAETDIQATVWGHYPPEVACVAVSSIETAAAADARTHGDMSAAAAAGGGRLHGEQFRLKSPASLARKVSTKQENATKDPGKETDAAAIAAGITDITRYTAVCTDHDQIVDTTVATVKDLQGRGWKIREAEQSYVAGNPYKGVHLVMEHNEDGQVVELQVHSETSQALKDRSHLLYERSRDTSLPMRERRAATDEGKQLYVGLPAPAGLDALGKRLGTTVKEKRYKEH